MKSRVLTDRWLFTSALFAFFAVLSGRHAALAQNPAATGTDAKAELPAESAPAEESAKNAPPASAPAGLLPGNDPLEENFADYLHFALVGQFEIADKLGKALLQRPEVNPLTKEGAEKLLMISEKYKNSIDTLLLIINNTPLADDAKKILELVRESHRQARMAPNRITENIKLLAGTPVQQSVGMERLLESGEYAVPWLLEVLGNPQKQDLHGFVVKALPQLGKKAVNPLVQALSIDDPVVRGAVAEALGRIGYPQALPYLARVVADPKVNDAVRAAAVAAVKRIVVADPAVKQLPPAELFRDLAEQYYANVDSLRPDASEPRANVWFVQNGLLSPVEVPNEIYPFVMAMRAARASLALAPDQPKMVALWVAANFRREAALGMDVTSEEAVDSTDLTRPADFPRSIYFARLFGPVYSQIALARAVKDRDPAVALGAIAALDVTAGPATMVAMPHSDAASLAAALSFPELLVRIRAALALGRALPQQPFRDSAEVVPALASAVQLTGGKNYLLVEPDAALRAKLEEDLRRGDGTVVSAERFSEALDGAHKQLTHLDGIFLSTDMDRPTVVEAVRTLADDRRFSLTPVVLIVQQNDDLVADRVNESDRRVGRVYAVTNGEGSQAKLAEQLLARGKEIAPKFGHHELPPELSTSLALEAARTLRTIAVNRSPVLDIRGAEASLISALGHPSEELRIAAAEALALIDSAGAQRAIAVVALGADQTESLRKAAFASLAESARRFGSKLEDTAVQKLIEQAVTEPNLALRTAASQALGAMNLPGKPVAEIILSQPQE